MADLAPAGTLNAVMAHLPRALRPVASRFWLRDERAGDVAARERLLDAAFGPDRFAKTCERLREGRLAAESLSFVAAQGSELIGTLRFWHVEAGRHQSLLLGPLAVSAAHRSAGIGRALIKHGLDRARKLGHNSVILVGDAPYYTAFGFQHALAEGLTLPGPVDPARFLGLDLVPGALATAYGRVVGAGLLVERRGRDGLRRAA